MSFSKVSVTVMFLGKESANWVSFDFNVAYSSCWGYSLINTLKLRKMEKRVANSVASRHVRFCFLISRYAHCKCESQMVDKKFSKVTSLLDVPCKNPHRADFWEYQQVVTLHIIDTEILEIQLAAEFTVQKSPQSWLLRLSAGNHVANARHSLQDRPWKSGGSRPQAHPPQCPQLVNCPRYSQCAYPLFMEKGKKRKSHNIYTTHSNVYATQYVYNL